MPAPITRALGQLIADLRYEAMPALAVEAVKTAATDGVGIMIDALDMAYLKRFHATLTTRGVNDEARIYLGSERTSAAEAAFINGVAMAAQDYDDVAFARCHTTAVILPSILAEADAIGASGRDVISAYAAGFEVWARIFDYEQDSYPDKGWHATSAWGALGAAAAVANLRKLDAETATRALAIAASMTGGLTGGLPYGTRLTQFSRASAAGVEAVRLAMAGLTAPPDALEATGGLISALSPKGNYDLDKPVAPLDSDWRLASVGVSLKMYPFFNSSQRTLDSVFALIRDHDLRPEQVKSAAVVIGTAQARALGIGGPPKRVYFAQADMALAVAIALLNRAVERQHLQPTYYKRPEVQDLLTRITIEISEDAPSDGDITYLGGSGKVKMVLTDGRALETPYAAFNRGHWSDRVTPDEMWRKFEGCTARFVPKDRARNLFDKLQNLEQVGSVAELSIVAR